MLATMVKTFVILSLAALLLVAGAIVGSAGAMAYAAEATTWRQLRLGWVCLRNTVKG